MALPTAVSVPHAEPQDGEGVDDGGPRRQPELTDIAHLPDPDDPASDLFLLDEDDAPTPFPSQLDPRLQRAARLAALDPDDGIAL
jgi:type IV secretion system protein VirD4